MSVVGDLVESVVDSALKEILRKTTGIGRRARRRRRTTASGTLRQIEKLLRPARKQVSRRKTTQSRSRAQRLRVAAKTRRHRRSLRRGAATR
jgi:hypothetical protein